MAIRWPVCLLSNARTWGWHWGWEGTSWIWGLGGPGRPGKPSKRGGRLRPPSLGRVLLPPGAAQTPKSKSVPESGPPVTAPHVQAYDALVWGDGSVKTRLEFHIWGGKNLTWKTDILCTACPSATMIHFTRPCVCAYGGLLEIAHASPDPLWAGLLLKAGRMDDFAVFPEAGQN